MNGTESTTETPALPTRRLMLATGAILFTGWLGDFLFWDLSPGVSLGVYFTIIGSLLLILGQRTSSGMKAFILLVATAIQSGVELSFTNVACLVALLIVLFADTIFASLAPVWNRWSEALFKVLVSVFRWGPFLRDWEKTKVAQATAGQIHGRTLGKLVTAALPAVVVVIVFSIFLSSGNAVLAELFSRFGSRTQTWLLDISFSRTILLFAFLTLGVGLYWPAAPREKQRWWTRPIPVWKRADAFMAKWQSLLLLAAVNVLFFAANTIDVIYLWANKAVPAGVNYSQFVHEGVHGLIAAVILAAVILVALFQQQSSITQSRGMRVLALVWIAQNIVLIFGVLRRLQLYVEAYQLSELRVYVACFLALVTFGFLLLARHAWSGMKLGKLLLQNMIATFVLFFGLQFCDVATWVANWNVSRWQTKPDVILDLEYLRSLGSGGWPALAKVARNDRNRDIAARAAAILRETAMDLHADLATRDWRSFQARHDARAEVVVRDWAP